MIEKGDEGEDPERSNQKWFGGEGPSGGSESDLPILKKSAISDWFEVATQSIKSSLNYNYFPRPFLSSYNLSTSNDLSSKVH